jgi:Flp pilus assembly protein TadG
MLNRIVGAFACRKGTAGIEFAIMTPVLLGGLIIMTDIGLALNAQMNLDQAVKSGAQFVMGDVSNTTDLNRLMTAAATGASYDDPNNVNSENAPEFDTLQSCKCPGSDATVACNSYCASGSVLPYMYYDITGTQTYEAMTLPDFELRSTIRVQTR